MQLPSYLQNGDRLAVIAPCGALKERTAFEKGIEVWRSRGYQLDILPQSSEIYGYLAGKDESRRKALESAWLNPDYKGILCARGGYGSTRLLEQWQWGKSSAKWVIGFSDVTGLLWSLAKQGISSLHAPVLTTIVDEPSWSQDRLFSYLKTGILDDLQGRGWGNGRVTGTLLPANLTVATHLLGTVHQPALNGVILALEDVSEPPYRLDRLLTHWRMLGAFQGVVGIALGRFSRCEGSSGTWTVEEMLSDRLGDLGIPIVSELPFGHDGVNAALPVGIQAHLDGDKGILSFM